MQQSVKNAIAGLPAAMQDVLISAYATDSFCGVLAATDVVRWVKKEQIPLEQVMLALLPLAKAYAAPPISDFYVGAVAQGLSGALYFGANMEFPGQMLNATVHAEQAAVMHAWLHGEEGLTAIAVNGIPCGHCRQFLIELSTAPTLRVITPQTGIVPLADMLPHAFGPSSLDNATGLMHPTHHDLTLATPSSDDVTLAALAAANRSYAPYSHGYAGVALQLDSGVIVAAPYAENVAFNPSLPPLQGALIHLHLAGQNPLAIVKAVLVEQDSVLCQHAEATRLLLRSFTQTELIVAAAVG